MAGRSWTQVDDTKDDVPIVLVIRTDECDLNDIVISALAAAYPRFASVFPAGTRAMTKAAIVAAMPAESKLIVREVASDIQMDAQITFAAYSLGMRTKIGDLPGAFANIYNAAADKTLTLNEAGGLMIALDRH